MDRVNVAFAVVVALSAILGGVATAERAEDLRSQRLLYESRDDLRATFSAVTVDDDELRVTVTFHNAAEYDFRVTGGYLVATNATTPKLAASAATRVDDDGSTLPADGTLTVRYALPLADDQRGAVERARRAGDLAFRLRVTVHLNDRTASVEFQGREGVTG